jgi:hypothetical protein
MQVNQDEVQQMSVSGQSTVGAYFVVQGYQIPVVLSESEVSTLLASYSPSSSSSPSEATSRQIARLVLDALLAAGA